MLIKFTVENYKNFKEPITIDFTEKHDYKFNSSCVKDGLLTKAIIYGENASGKSNLGFAIFDIVGLLTDKNIEKYQLDQHSFINADSDNNSANFEYLFRKDKKTKIRYAYKKTEPQKIIFEELYVNDKKVFSYDFLDKENKDFANLNLIDANTLNFEYYEDNLSILRYIANNTIQSENSIVKYIMNFVSKMLWFRSLQGNGYIGFTTGVEDIIEWILKNDYVKEFQGFLKNIANLDFNLNAIKVGGELQNKLLIEKHKNKVMLFDQIASSGTKALELLFYWSKKFDDVSFLFMDEFDAFYHYELSRKVIEYIKEKKNLQVVFTTHNTYLAGNDVLRPDCYFILSKGKLNSFADSTDRELREGHNLEKMLRNGEFDA